MRRGQGMGLGMHGIFLMLRGPQREGGGVPTRSLVCLMSMSPLHGGVFFDPNFREHGGIL